MQAARHYLEGIKNQTSRSLMILTIIQSIVDVIVVLLTIKGTIPPESLLLLLNVPSMMLLVGQSYIPTKRELFLGTILNRIVMFSHLVFISGTLIACIEYTTSWYHLGKYLTMMTLCGMNFMCGLFTDEDFRSLSIYMRLEQEFPVSMLLHGYPRMMKTAAVA